MSLRWVGQDDFAVGTLVGLGQDQLPGVGLERALNVFFDDDGDMWRRGAVTREGTAAPQPLTWIWSGYLGDTYRMLVATAASLYAVTGAVLTDLGVAGLAEPVQPAVVGDTVFLPNGVAWNGVATSAIVWPPALPAGTRHLGTAFGRLIVGSQNIVAFSAAGDPTSFAATDYHELPAGVAVRAIWTIRDQVLVFTNYGLFAITGMAFDLTDALGNPQQTLSRLTPEISLLHEAGLADWAGQVITPCTDRVYLIDGLSAPVPISDSIGSQYMSYVRAGYLPGGAKTFRNHYFMPVLDGGDSVALLVCRVNRPIRARQLFYPWAQWDGYPDALVAFDVDLRDSEAPVFRGAHTDGWRVNLTQSFPPFSGTSPVVDPDGSAPVLDVETRDFPTGNGQPNHVRRLRIFYFAVGEGEIEVGYSYGAAYQRYLDVTASGRTYADVAATYPTYADLTRGMDPTNPDWTPITAPWDQGTRVWHVLDPLALIESGVEPLLWNLATAERQRYIRARLRSTDGIAQLKIRRVQFAVRPATHER